MKKDRWEARVSDLEPGDKIEVWCERCGHEAVIDAEVFMERAKSDPKDSGLHTLMIYDRVLNLKEYVKCSRCPVPLNGRPHREYYIRVIDGRRKGI